MKHAIVVVPLAASLLLTLASGASAQPGMPSTVPAQTDDVTDEPPARAPPRALVVVPAPDGEVEPPPSHPIGSRRSERTALLLSLGGTTVSWGLLLGGWGRSAVAATAGGIGVLIAPSLGHWYADTALTRGLGVRLLGTAVIFVGGVVGIESFFEQIYDHDTDDDISPAAKALVIGGFVLVAAGTIDDIITAPLRVRRQNRARGWDVGLAPIVTQHSAGFALGGRF